MPDASSFAVKIDYEPGSPDPAHVFRAMSSLLDALALFDRELASTVGGRIRPTLLLERVEAGSVVAWLKTVVEEPPVDSTVPPPVPGAVESFLVQAKELAIETFLSKDEITDREDARELSQQIQELAIASTGSPLQDVSPLSVQKVLETASNVSRALANLHPGETAAFVTDDRTVPFNPRLRLGSEDVERLLTREVIVNESVMILKVRKPDYLGSTQWEFRHQRHLMEARIDHGDWLEQFHSRQVSVLPGDALRARVRSEVKYGYDGNVVGTHYSIVEVLEVMRYDQQEQLPLIPEAE